MSKRRIAQLAIGLLLGTAMGNGVTPWQFFTLFIFLVYIIVAMKESKEIKLRRCSFVIGCCCIGAMRGGQDMTDYLSFQQTAQTCEEISITGEVQKKTSNHSKTSYLIQTNEILLFQPEESTVLFKSNKIFQKKKIIVSSCQGNYQVGDMVACKGNLEPYQPISSEGMFDLQPYDRGNQIYGRMQEKEGVVLERKKGFSFYLELLREQMAAIYQKNLPGEESGLLTAITIGDKTKLDEDVKYLFQKVGMAHILVVSGMHLSILGQGVYRFLRKRGISFGGAGGIAIVITGVFVLFSGASIGSVRAFLMFCIFLMAELLGKKYDGVCALAIAAMIQIFFYPLSLENTSFLLSYGMVLGVHLFALPLTKRFTGWKKTVCFSILLWFYSFVLLAYCFYEIFSYSFLINMLILPFLPILFSVGLLSCIVSMIVPNLITDIGWRVCHVILYCYEWLADISLNWKGAMFVLGKPTFLQIMLFVILLYLFWRTFGKKKYLIAVICFISGIIVLSYHPKDFRIVMLDVGQGDGILIQSEEGIHVMIDGGSTSVKEVGKKRILPYLKYQGIRKIDYWFVSHGDLDHISGLMEALEENYKIGCIVVSDLMIWTEESKRMITLAKKRNVPIYEMSSGEQLKEKGLTFTSITKEHKTGEDPNENSLVLLLEAEDFRGVFTGDIGIDIEQEIGKKVQSPVIFYKAAHHGSNNSNSEEFLNICKPKLIGISCGKNNSYSHPGKDALARMEQQKAKIAITYQTGRVCYRKKQGEWVMEPFLLPEEN